MVGVGDEASRGDPTSYAYITRESKRSGGSSTMYLGRDVSQGDFAPAVGRRRGGLLGTGRSAVSGMGGSCGGRQAGRWMLIAVSRGQVGGQIDVLQGWVGATPRD